jgi:hypothetical protein
MTAPDNRSSQRPALGRAAKAAGSDEAPLDFLLRTMRDPDIGNDERIEVAKICLPFVHPRIAQLHPSEKEPEPEQRPRNIADPGYIRGLILALCDSMSVVSHHRQELPAVIWNDLTYVPRSPEEMERWRVKGRPLSGA